MFPRKNPKADSCLLLTRPYFHSTGRGFHGRALCPVRGRAGAPPSLTPTKNNVIRNLYETDPLFRGLFLLFLLISLSRPALRKHPQGSLRIFPPDRAVAFNSNLPLTPSAYYEFMISQFNLREGRIDQAIEHLKRAIELRAKTTPFCTWNWPASTFTNAN